MVNGWVPTSLGDILTQERRPVVLDPEKKYAEIGVYSYGRGIFHKEPRTGVEVGSKDLYEIKRGDFIFQITFAWEGAIALASEAEDGMYGSVRFPTYRVNEDICYPKFLLNYFKTEEGRREVGRISPGSAGRNRVLATKRLPDIFVPLPSLTEQRRIVAHIESLAARVNEARCLREEADLEGELLFASYLKATRHRLLESDFPKSKIGDIATVTSGGTPSRDNPTYWGGDIPWIKTGELIDGAIYDSEEHITEEGMRNSSARLFPPETILIALYGQGQTRGRTARLMIEATTNQACCAILPTPEILDSRFTQYWQRSLYYEMREKSHGGAQPNWNGGMIKNIEIALPPLDEQRRIVAYLDGLQAKVNALRGLQSASGEELSALMPSILDKAFKGEL